MQALVIIYSQSVKITLKQRYQLPKTHVCSYHACLNIEIVTCKKNDHNVGVIKHDVYIIKMKR